MYYYASKLSAIACGTRCKHQQQHMSTTTATTAATSATTMALSSTTANSTANNTATDTETGMLLSETALTRGGHRSDNSTLTQWQQQQQHQQGQRVRRRASGTQMTGNGSSADGIMLEVGAYNIFSGYMLMASPLF